MGCYMCALVLFVLLHCVEYVVYVLPCLLFLVVSCWLLYVCYIVVRCCYSVYYDVYVLLCVVLVLLWPLFGICSLYVCECCSMLLVCCVFMC